MARRVLFFLAGLFLARSALEDLIDNVWPQSKVRLVIGVCIMLYFGYSMLKNGNWKRWLK